MVYFGKIILYEILSEICALCIVQYDPYPFGRKINVSFGDVASQKHRG